MFRILVWDALSSEEAVGLVASHLESTNHPPVPARHITSSLLPLSTESASIYPQPEYSPGGVKGQNRDCNWVYQDENASTHLIRNSLIGNDSKKNVRELLSMKPPVSRWLRDDVTCT